MVTSWILSVLDPGGLRYSDPRTCRNMADPAVEVSKKLNVVIALLLHFAKKDAQFNGGRLKTGDLATYLKRHGLQYDDIAAILDSPVSSVRVLVHLKGHTGKRNSESSNHRNQRRSVPAESGACTGSSCPHFVRCPLVLLGRTGNTSVTPTAFRGRGLECTEEGNLHFGSSGLHR